MPREEIRVTGLGGQGVILLGYVLGKAASLFGARQAVMTQSFGPEARGSACSAQVVISEARIAYPSALQPGFLIALSQDGYNRYITECAPDARVFVEADLVHPAPNGHPHLAVPATRLAEGLGRRVVLNMVMLGFFGRHWGGLDQEAYRRAILDSVPRGTEELNLAAFQRGWEAAEVTGPGGGGHDER